MPRTIPAGMTPAAEQRTYFQLFKITLLDATILRYTDADVSILHDVGDGAGVVTWDAGPGISRKEIRAGIDLQIDTTQVTVPNIDLALGGVTKTIAHWARLRRFHAAQVDLYIHDYDNNKSVLHSTWFIQGVVAATFDDVTFLLESIISKLDLQVPRTTFQPECNNALYDAWCGVIKANFKDLETVDSATIDSVTFTTARVAGYFDLGQVKFTSGNLNGMEFTIATNPTQGVVKFYAPLPEVPTAGTTFDIFPGCHKTIADCRDKFNNFFPGGGLRFRGFPFIPDAEQAIG